MIKYIGILSFILLLSACTLTPEPISMDERYSEAKKNMKTLFAHHHTTTIHKKLDYFEALAFSIKYNLDYRIKLANNALQENQLTLAQFAMFPALNVNGSLYTRSNSLASFGVTTDGTETGVLNSTPKTLRSTRIALSWNILDFGVSYVRAQQQGDRYFIALEEARKQMQQLSQDVLTAYWEAYSAQELLKDTKEFQKILVHAKSQLDMAVIDKTIPKENILHYQEALLDGNRHLLQLQQKYDKAMLDLKHLLNLPLSWHFTLEAPPSSLLRIQDLKNADFRKIDAITLVNRPELRGQSYHTRIAKYGIRAAVLQALPGISLNPGYNYNSNKFLINRMWIDRSVDVAWNLLNLASLPTSLDSAEAQLQYEKLKLMALTLAVLTETRYAYSKYQGNIAEFRIAHQQTANAQALYKLIENRNRASLASSQQAILAKLRAITAKMDEDLLHSNLSKSLGELYLSTGFDILPYGITNEPIPVIVKKLKKRFETQKTMDFNAYVNITYNKMFTKYRKQTAKK